MASSVLTDDEVAQINSFIEGVGRMLRDGFPMPAGWSNLTTIIDRLVSRVEAAEARPVEPCGTDSVTTSPETRASLERGLRQEPTIDRGSFAQYAPETCEWREDGDAIKAIREATKGHTPGPWVSDIRVGCVAVYPSGEEHNCLSDAEHFAVHFSNRGAKYIEGESGGHWELPDETKADARLIAAAPDLFAALDEATRERDGARLALKSFMQTAAERWDRIRELTQERDEARMALTPHVQVTPLTESLTARVKELEVRHDD